VHLDFLHIVRRHDKAFQAAVVALALPSGHNVLKQHFGRGLVEWHLAVTLIERNAEALMDLCAGDPSFSVISKNKKKMRL
jgi:hypothetical protein